MTASRPRIVIAGGGSIGERHARCFMSTGRVDVALCELDSGKRNAVVDRYNLSAGYDSWDAALADGPDAVVIATPAPLHIPMALQAISANCHVFIEKPLSTGFAGIAELTAAAAARQRLLDVAYVTRCHPVLGGMRTALQSGRFGKPLQLVSVSGQNFPFYRPAYRETYYTRHETGGGAVQDALTHSINAAEWLVGPIDRLVADAEHLALPGVTVEDTVNVLTRHGNLVGSFSLNQHQAPNESSFTVVCERGTVRYESHRQRWLSMTEPGGEWHEEQVQILERDDLFTLQAQHFLDVVAGRTTPQCPIAEAVQTLRVNLAILESVRSGSWQTISRD